MQGVPHPPQNPQSPEPRELNAELVPPIPAAGARRHYTWEWRSHLEEGTMGKDVPTQRGPIHTVSFMEAFSIYVNRSPRLPRPELR
jgi:hypothetical protein